MELIKNTPAIGNELWRSQKKNRPEGDYQHDGDLGGGQYLNACVWYEVLTRKSCVGNTWRPTTDLCGYTLDEDMIVALQNAAHKVVVAHYGNNYHTDSFDYDTIKDGEINIGSSTGYYFPDEISQMLNAEVGVTARVGMAYHSGVKLQEQWSWAKNETGDYAFRLYLKDSVTAEVNTSAGKTFDGCGFDKFIELYDWDAIGIYQAPGAFDDNISPEAYEACLKTCSYADNLYAFYKTFNPDSRYLWYQGATKAVGYPGVSANMSGYIFGDTCTDAVFAGWPELKDGEKVETGVTFLDGTEFYDSSKNRVAAVNYLNGGTEKILTKAEAEEIRYPASSYENVADIRPIDIVATITLDGENSRLYDPCCKFGGAPSVGRLVLKNGTVHDLQGDTNTDKDAGLEENYYGDMIIEMYGGKITNAIYMSWDLNLVGDLIIKLEGTEEAPLDAGKTVRGHFGSGTIQGDTTITIKHAKLSENFYGGGSDGTVTNIIENTTFGNNYFGVRSRVPKDVHNTLTNVEIGGQYFGGHYNGDISGNVYNTLTNVTTKGLTHMGSYSQETSDISGNVVNNLTNVTTENITSMGHYCEGKIKGSITSTIKDCTFKSDVYLSSYKGSVAKNVTTTAEGLNVPLVTASDGTTTNTLYGGQEAGSIGGNLSTTFKSGTVDTLAIFGSKGTVGGTITNNVSGGTFALKFFGSGPIESNTAVINKISGSAIFKGAFHGTFSEDNTGNTVGNVTTEVSGSPVFESTFYTMGYDTNADASNNKTLTVKISGGTFKGSAYMSGRILRNRVATITISKGTFNGIAYMGAYNGIAKEINTTIKGGTFKDYVYCGNNGSTKNVDAKKITTTIEGGTFNGTFYGGCKDYKAGAIHNIVKGGTFKNSFIGGSGGSGSTTVVTSITNEFLGGTFENIYAGTRYGSVETITNTVDGAKINQSFHGSYGGTANLVQNTIKSAEITGSLYLGCWNGTAESIVSLVKDVTVATDFYGGNKKGTCNSVTNTIENATVSGALYCGSTEGTCGDITNTIENATVTGSLYCGSKAGTCTGITSTINNATVGSSIYCASGGGTVQGKVKTTINDCYVDTYTYLSGNCTVKEPEGFDEKYLVECEIFGGTFKGVWGGGANASSTAITTCDIKITVYGGTFNLYDAGSASRQNALSTGGRNKKHVGDVDAFIYGGTFGGEVIAGACPNSSGSDYTHTDEGTHTVTIYGGTFNKPLLANSKWGTVTNGKIILNTSESDITINSTMTMRDISAAQSYEIVGGDHKIILGENAKLEANKASGSIFFEQADEWKMNTSYVTLPAGNTAEITTGITSTGKGVATKIYDNTSVVEVKGGASLYGVTFILDERLNIRAVFDPNVVSYGDAFTYKFSMGDRILAEGTELEEYQGYATVVLKGLGAADFATPITYSGDLMYGGTFTVVELADYAAKVWSNQEILCRLAKSIADFGRVAKGDEDVYNLTANAVEWTRPAGSAPQDTAITFSSKSLLMSNAVGIRLYGTEVGGDGKDLDIKVRINGKDVTDRCLFKEGENGKFTLDFFINASKMDREFRIVITNADESVTYLDLTERPDYLAYQYVQAGNPLANQLLLYIQAAIDYFTEI